MILIIYILSYVIVSLISSYSLLIDRIFFFFFLTLIIFFFIFFFFSSRRRHTRSYGDWSSDVCSSDLYGVQERGLPRPHLAGQDDEALPLLDAVLELGERLPVARAHVQEPGIGRRVEGLLRETVEVEVHSALLRNRRAPGPRPDARSRVRSGRRCRRSGPDRRRPRCRPAAYDDVGGGDRLRSRCAEC